MLKNLSFAFPRNVLLISFLSTLLLLTGCEPHPAAGVWLSDGENKAKITKILVHFEPHAEIYTQGRDEPVLFCGWSATSSQDASLECMKTEEQEVMDIYQLKISGESKAELIYKDKVIARFTQIDD